MKHSSISFILLAVLISCKKEFDEPPVKPAEFLNKINIANIKAKYVAGVNYRFKGDSSLYCVVTADESGGNLYKEIYVRDVTGALHVELVNSGGIYIGDSIRINLKGTSLNSNNSLIQLDSVDAEKSIVKLASGYNPQPVGLSIQQIVSNTTANNAAQSKLVKIENVEFVAADQDQTYADAVNRANISRVIRACSGQTLSVRTSGFCSFAGKRTPKGNGSITGIVTQFGNSMSLVLRNYTEVSMPNALCIATSTSSGYIYLGKNFEDNSLTSGGWINSVVTNTLINWSVSSVIGSSYFAKISPYAGSSIVASESWYISPAIDLSKSVNPVLVFQTAAKFSGLPLQVLVSVNYSSGAPATATWTSLAPAYALSPTTGNYLWTPSGAVSLSTHKKTNVRIAFKYQSANSSGSTYELDDIVVKEN